MSHLTWHTPTASAVLDGPEAHYAHHMVGRLATGLLPLEYERERLAGLLPEGHYLRDSRRDRFDHPNMFAADYRITFRGGHDDLIVYRGRPVDVFALQLNTAIQVGSDPMRLLARIAGQGELHLTIPGEHRAWVADLIGQGLDARLLRTGMGWETPARNGRHGDHSILSLLHERSDEPVVLAHSVTDSWPNHDVGDWMPAWPEGVARDYRLLTTEQQAEREERSEAWYELTTEQQWQHCLTGLDTLPQLTPDQLGVRFGHGLSVLDLDGPHWEHRLADALLPDTETCTSTHRRSVSACLGEAGHASEWHSDGVIAWHEDGTTRPV